MSDDNAELIAEAKALVEHHHFTSYAPWKDVGIPMIERLAVALEAAQPSPVQGTDDENRAFDWAEYRKDYQPNPSHFAREAIAFRAGWNAAASRRSPSVADLTAKADAWDEGVIAKSNSSSIFDRDVLAKNPYRTPVTGEDKA